LSLHGRRDLILHVAFEFFEKLLHHWRSHPTTTDLFARLAFVQHRESITRIVEGHETTEPRQALVLRSRPPLRGAGLATDLRVIHRRALRRAIVAGDHVTHA